MKNVVKSWIVKHSRKIMEFLGVVAVGATVTACYGSPYGVYEVKGQVVDQDLNPIKGIMITPDKHLAAMAKDSLSEGIEPNSYFQTMTTLSDGTFYIKDSNWFFEDKLYAVDIDGPANGGEFQQTEVTFEFVQTEAADNWFEGAFVANNITIVMKPAAQQAEQ